MASVNAGVAPARVCIQCREHVETLIVVMKGHGVDRDKEAGFGLLGELCDALLLDPMQSFERLAPGAFSVRLDSRKDTAAGDNECTIGFVCM